MPKHREKQRARGETGNFIFISRVWKPWTQLLLRNTYNLLLPLNYFWVRCLSIVESKTNHESLKFKMSFRAEIIRKFLKARLYWVKANAKGKIFLDLPLFCMNSILSFLRTYLEAMSLFLGVSDPLEWEVARIIKSMRPPVFRSRRWSPDPLAFLPSRSSRFSSCPNQKYHFQVKKKV